MGGDFVKAKRYRERADALRKIAKDMPGNNTQRIILGIALEYERLARLFEEDDGDGDAMDARAALKKPDNSN